MIEVEYKSLNQTRYRNFNATLLNETAAIVNASLASTTITAPNYLFATLVASNATVDPGNGDDGGSGMSTSDGGGNPPTNPRSSLAMYALLAVDYRRILMLST